MSSNAIEWSIVAIFFLCFALFTAGEASWLKNRYAVETGRGLAFSFASNLFCITVGFFISFVILAVIMAMAWDGSLQNVPGGNASIWVALIAAGVVPILVLAGFKALLLRVFRFEQITHGLKYSLAASFLFVLCVTLIPFGAAYILIR